MTTCRHALGAERFPTAADFCVTCRGAEDDPPGGRTATRWIAALQQMRSGVLPGGSPRSMVTSVATAGRLAEYLQLYLDGRPLPIRPPSTAETLWR